MADLSPETLEKYSKFLKSQKKSVQHLDDGGTAEEGFLQKFRKEHGADTSQYDSSLDVPIAESEDIPDKSKEATELLEQVNDLTPSAQALHEQVKSPEQQEISDEDQLKGIDTQSEQDQQATGEPSTDVAMGVSQTASEAAAPPSEDKMPTEQQIESQVNPTTPGAPTTSTETLTAPQEPETVPAPAKPMAAPTQEEVPFNQLSPQAQLAEVFRQQNQQIQNVNIQKAAHLIASGLLKQAPHPEIYDQQYKQAQQLVPQFLAIQEMSKEDPTSDYSKSARDAVGKALHIDLPDTLSGAALEKILPGLELPAKFAAAQALVAVKGANAKDLEDKKEENREALAGVKGQTDENVQKKLTAQQGNKQQAETNKREDSFTKDLSDLKGRRGYLSEPNRIKQLAERLDGMVANKNFDELSKPEYAEIVNTFNSLGAPGSNTDVKFKKLLQQTGIQSVQDLKTWLLNNPEPAKAGAFIKLLKDNADQISKTASAQIDDAYIARGKSAEAAGVSPEFVKKQLKIQGISEDDYNNWKPGSKVSAAIGQKTAAVKPPQPVAGPGETVYYSPSKNAYYIKDAQGTTRPAQQGKAS
jgi:hypothetical protein